MGVSKNRCTPKIINSNMVFPYKPSILGVFPLFSEFHPSKYCQNLFESHSTVPTLNFLDAIVELLNPSSPTKWGCMPSNTNLQTRFWRRCTLFNTYIERYPKCSMYGSFTMFYQSSAKIYGKCSIPNMTYLGMIWVPKRFKYVLSTLYPRQLIWNLKMLFYNSCLSWRFYVRFLVWQRISHVGNSPEFRGPDPRLASTGFHLFRKINPLDQKHDVKIYRILKGGVSGGNWEP